jgi:hypothetical protein
VGKEKNNLSKVFKDKSNLRLVPWPYKNLAETSNYWRLCLGFNRTLSRLDSAIVNVIFQLLTKIFLELTFNQMLIKHVDNHLPCELGDHQSNNQSHFPLYVDITTSTKIQDISLLYSSSQFFDNQASMHF